MSLGSPFGFGPLPQVSPEDLAALMRRAPLGPAQSFAGGGPTVAMDEAQTQQLERGMGMTPGAPAPRTVPLPPARPLTFGAIDAQAPSPDMPAPSAVPAAGQMPTATPAAAAAPAEPSLGDRIGSGLDTFRKNGGFDLLGNIGIGLMSTHGLGNGLAAGLKLDQDAQTKRAATDLARAEYGLKARKLAQDAAGQNATKTYLLGKGFDENLANAAMANPTVLSSVLSQINKDPSVVEVVGNKYSLRPGEKPSDANLLGPAKDPNEADRYVLSDLQDGSKIAVNRTDPTDVKIIAPGQVARPATEEERRAFGVAPGTAVKMTAKDGPVAIGGATTNVSVAGPEKEQDKVVGKSYGDLQVDLATKGRNAASTLNTLSLMEQAMRAPGFYSGVGGEGVKRANQFLGALGVKDPKAASAAEVFDALSNKVVLDGLGGSLGPGISNTDRDYIARTAPTLAQSEQGNRDLIGIARSLAQRQQAVAKLARDYAGAHGGRLDAGFDQQLEDFAAQNPLFPQAQAASKASAPQEPPQGAPPGTRMAPDGRFYAADPTRPGKYLLVR
jgi:hypothetical protein